MNKVDSNYAARISCWNTGDTVNNGSVRLGLAWFTGFLIRDEKYLSQDSALSSPSDTWHPLIFLKVQTVQRRHWIREDSEQSRSEIAWRAR